MKECIILAGGLGTRLRERFPNTPKCLVPVNEIPFICHQLRMLQSIGINNFILALGYKSDVIIKALSKYEKYFPNLNFSIENKQLGTGGAIKLAMENFNLKESIVINGDTFIEGDLSSFVSPLNKSEQIRIAVLEVENRSRYGGLEISFNGQVENFLEKGISTPGLINAGFYIVNQKVFKKINKQSFSLEKEVFNNELKSKHLFAKQIRAEFIDIGLPEDYEIFCNSHKLNVL